MILLMIFDGCPSEKSYVQVNEEIRSLTMETSRFLSTHGSIQDQAHLSYPTKMMEVRSIPMFK